MGLPGHRRSGKRNGTLERDLDNVGLHEEEVRIEGRRVVLGLPWKLVQIAAQAEWHEWHEWLEWLEWLEWQEGERGERGRERDWSSEFV